MSFEIQTMPTANKQTRYEHLIEDIATLISGEHREISVMANVAAAIRQAFSFSGSASTWSMATICT